MTKRTLNSELQALCFAMSTNQDIQADALARKILDDFNETLLYARLHKPKRFLIWGLLIGRCADCFTKFYLNFKGVRCIGQDKFSNRINTIINPINPLTTDMAIITDLHIVRDYRNDLFHQAGYHFSEPQMETFVFKTVNSIQQLLMDM
jgi:hypothetical protein